MPLYATHIRLALDLNGKYQAQNLEQFVAGILYPDTRNYIGTQRELTHPRRPEADRLALGTDFEKGWHAHLVGDWVFPKAVELIMPGSYDDAKLEQWNEEWVKASSLKVLQDIEDAKQFNVYSYLKDLTYCLAPNGENLAEVREFNNFFVEFYANLSDLTPAKYESIFRFWHFEESIIAKIRQTIERNLADKAVNSKISDLSEAMLWDARSNY